MSEDLHSSNNVLVPCRICGQPVIDGHPGEICTNCLLPAHHTTDTCPHLVVDRFGRCEACYKTLGSAIEPTPKEVAWLAAGRIRW